MAQCDFGTLNFKLLSQFLLKIHHMHIRIMYVASLNISILEEIQTMTLLSTCSVRAIRDKLVSGKFLLRKIRLRALL